MSSRGRGAEDYTPDPNGFYQTPESATRAILPHLGIEPGMVILEPGCGNGAIARVLRRKFGGAIKIVGVEIDSGRARQARSAKEKLPDGQKLPVFDSVIRSDLFKLEPGSYDLCVTNPSFPIWLPVAEYCFKSSERTTLLIPWNSAASKKRAAWWAQHPAYLRLLSRRPSFAVSVKCVMTNGRAAKAAERSVCSFQEMIPIDEEPKRECPVCGERTTTTSSDSNEYCWAQWAPDITFNRWDPLETPTDDQEEKAAAPEAQASGAVAPPPPA